MLPLKLKIHRNVNNGQLLVLLPKRQISDLHFKNPKFIRIHNYEVEE